MRKKILAGILMGAMVLALAGCGEKKTANENSEATKTPTQVTDEGEKSDSSETHEEEQVDFTEPVSAEELANMRPINLSGYSDAYKIKQIFKTMDENGVLTIPSYIIDDGEKRRVESIDGFYISDSDRDLSDIENNLTKVIIPETVVSVESSFFSFPNLQEVVIPSSVKVIDSSFSNCPNLREVVIPETVESLKGGSFGRCSNLESVEFHGDKTAIDGAGAFENSTWLTNLIMENETGFVIVDGQLLACLVTEDYVELPEEVRSIAGGAFDYEQCAIGELVIKDETIKLYREAFNTYWYKEAPRVKKVVFDCDLVSLAEHAFFSSEVEEVVFKSLEIIEKSAFSMSDRLTKVVLPNNLKEIGESAFSNIETLEEITLPDSLEIIGKDAFSSCESLKSIVIPNNVSVVEDCAFSHCESLESVVLSETLEEIDYMTFVECESLKEIVIPGSVKRIGGYAFQGCAEMERVEFNEGLLEIEGLAFAGCRKLKTFDLPESLTTIGSKSFQCCTQIESIKIKNNTVNIESSAFSDCTALKEAVLPETLTEIPLFLFSNCTSLETITIPEGVTKICQGAFKNCSNLIIDIPEGCELGPDALLGVKDVK